MKVLTRVALGAGVVVLAAAVAAADQKPVTGPAAKLPAAVLKAFQQSYPNAAIKAADRETEDGREIWEVESVDNGQARNINYAADGTVLTVEETVPLASVPAAVVAALKAKYPKATIMLAEKTTEGRNTFYELTLKGASVTTIELMPDGSPVPAAKK